MSSDLKFRFSAAQAAVDASFFQELAKKKMEDWQLDATEKHPLMAQVLNAPSKCSLTFESFMPSADPPLPVLRPDSPLSGLCPPRAGGLLVKLKQFCGFLSSKYSQKILTYRYQ
jgi:hypothetical protein